MTSILSPIFVSVNGIITESMFPGRMLWINTVNGQRGIINSDGREVRKVNERWIYEV